MKKRVQAFSLSLPSLPPDYFSIFRATLSLSPFPLPLSSLVLFPSFSRPSSLLGNRAEAARRSDEDHTYVVTARDDRRMILGRHSPLVKFAGELLRHRCQINRGKALLSRSNRRDGGDDDEKKDDREKTRPTRLRRIPDSPRRSWESDMSHRPRA